MGPVQKIFYFHVPSAYSMYLAWLISTVGAVAALSTNREKWDHLAAAAAEIALVFAAMVMVSGPLWGRRAWGAFWVWDPRLTTSLLLSLIILATVILRTFDRSNAARRFAAATTIVGTCIIPLIHISVQMWRGQHPTVLRSGGLAPDMLFVFAVCMMSFTGMLAVLLHWRLRLAFLLAREDELRHSPPTPAGQYVPVDPASLGTVSATGLLATAYTVLPGILVAYAVWLTVRYRQAVSRLRTLEKHT
jgi:heme exporter protein C